MRKVRESGPKNTQWEYVYRLNWEAAHGPVPEGHRLICLGDKRDPSAENWVAAPKAAVISMHKKFPGGLAAAPNELRYLILATGLLKSKLRFSVDSDVTALPRSRAAARRLNMRWYFTGIPCGNGHRAKRFTRSTNCYDCHNGSRSGA